ncbi:MAG: dipeptide ABC transporter ATP-binding protein [Gammaproteobacteria bacterium]|nr:dipeptide ABC transporter ATP-binding protein [Gammaproteobacteria bacterium]
MLKPLLSIQDLSVKFHVHGTNVDAVKGVSFDLYRGKTVALVGESGSGKSVISKAIMNLLPANGEITAGSIILNDEEKQLVDVDVTNLHPDSEAMRDLRGGSISLIFQEPMVSLSPLHTIGDQISEALFLHQEIGKKEGLNLTVEMLGLVGFSNAEMAVNLYPFELSGGMRQRAMIAMALICHPSLLIADEPTTALDVTIQAQILKLIRSFQTELNMAVLMITHDLGVVANVADEVVVIYHGEVMESGTVEHIFNDPQHRYTEALLHAVPRFNLKPGERLTPLREIKAEVGEFLKSRNNLNQVNQSKIILSVRNLNKSFGARSHAWSFQTNAPRVIAVDDVNFDLYRGESLGLVGESGSGKSTLSKMLVRALVPDSGNIIFDDSGSPMNVEQLDNEALFEYRCKVQYIFQDPVGSLNPSMTVFDIIREPMVIHNLGNMDYQIEAASELMRLVGLDSRYLRRYPHSFSGGQRQRIGIARALALQPELLICDEPVSALDVSIQAQVLNLMKDLQTELGLSYLFVTHNLAVVDYISDRIAVMYKGKFVEVADRKALFENPIHPYTKSLLSSIPVPDLNTPLNFDLISEPGADLLWPDEYQEKSDGRYSLIEVEPNHFVRSRDPH